MAKTRNKTPASADPVPQSREEAASFVMTIGALDRDIAVINAALSETIAKAKEQAEAQAKPLSERVAGLTRGLEQWASVNRVALTDNGKVKTVDLGTGRILWRQRPPSVVIRGVEAVIAALKEFGFPQFLRTKIEINKEAMLADPEVASRVPGVTIASAGEDFVVEPVSDATSQAAE